MYAKSHMGLARPLIHRGLGRLGRVSMQAAHPLRFQKMMGRRCLHVVKDKPSSNHIPAIPQNVAGCEHGQLDFHVLTKESSTYKFPSLKDYKPSFRRRRFILEEGGQQVDPKLRSWEVASWHIRTLPHHIPSTFERVCPQSHQNLVDERPTCKLTLISLRL